MGEFRLVLGIHCRHDDLLTLLTNVLQVIIAMMQNNDPECLSQLRHRRRAFSLLELLAVTTIIGIVASVVLPRIGQSASKAKGKACLDYKAQLNVAGEKFFLTNGETPKVINQLEDDDYYGSEVPACPVDGSVYRLNPTTVRVIGHHR